MQFLVQEFNLPAVNKISQFVPYVVKISFIHKEYFMTVRVEAGRN